MSMLSFCNASGGAGRIGKRETERETETGTVLTDRPRSLRSSSNQVVWALLSPLTKKLPIYTTRPIRKITPAPSRSQ